MVERRKKGSSFLFLLCVVGLFAVLPQKTIDGLVSAASRRGACIERERATWAGLSALRCLVRTVF